MTYTYEQMVAEINSDPTAHFTVMMHGQIVTLTGAGMRGFLLPSDTASYFKKFEV